MPSHYLAILSATIASYVAGSLWYLALGAPWRRALGWAETGEAYRPPVHALLVAFVAQLAMAAFADAALTHGGGATVARGVIAAGLAWAGLILPSLSTNVAFQRRSPVLIAIDGGHWLLVLLVIGIVLGLMA